MNRVQPTDAPSARPGVVVLLLLTAAAAWWSTADRMAGMDSGPGTRLGTFGWFLGIWTVMMTAMMLPSFAPTAAVYARFTRGRQRARWVAFAAGYLLTWSAAGVAAYAAFELGTEAFGSGLGWYDGGRWLAAGVLAMAAVYQVSPMKRACLERCRRPTQLPNRASDRWSQALIDGSGSGRWCIGSSWGMMAALFALGVMSLTWMALVAGLVAIEKLAPRLRTATLATALALAVLAAGLAIAPRAVPGLVVPDSKGMSMMG